ncbi:hypothetical protein DSM14862_04070 (plasmid) [Sulfitobacter indolifex]|uniref:Transmembrane protein n=1 Tax=Sulfitobacter indolifex HEL-45 TaxID=391624 RepID=A0ABM9X1Y8_9RHOB|nr:hypothetical protein [Sulfitobacter indolifex]EDQ03426.1 hypothetical protein OIHEL45_16956 [Sulfitobacter indolifex HEL-45]UOA21230.1 hypothetical protein DSM14862_04070 [Sulfitobacter indolifex]
MKADMHISYHTMDKPRARPAHAEESGLAPGSAGSGISVLMAAALLAFIGTIAVIMVYSISWFWWLPIYSALGFGHFIVLVALLGLRTP